MFLIYFLLHFKNKSLLKRLSWNRNEFVSNELRFCLNFFSNIFDFAHFGFLKSLNDCVLHICIDKNSMTRLTLKRIFKKFIIN